jgi:excisionase family DNA binding protein
MTNITKEHLLAGVAAQAAEADTPPPSELLGGVKTLTIPEVASLLRINRNVAYAAARRGEIPTIKFGRALRVPVAALRHLLGEAGQTVA